MARPRKPSVSVRAAADAAERRSKGIAESEPRVPIDPSASSRIAEALARPAEPVRFPIVSPGRTPKYRAKFAAIAKAMCRMGATDAELAAEFSVSTWTIWYWAAKHKAFSKALAVGKGAYDERVIRSLAQRAIGYSYNACKIAHHEGTPIITEYVEHVPPDPGAAKLWLTNRRPDDWRDKREVSGPNGGPIRAAVEITIVDPA